VVHSFFITQAEALCLQLSEFGLVLSSLILSKMQDTVTAEGLQKIATTITSYHAKVESEQRSAAAVIASSGLVESRGSSVFQFETHFCIHGWSIF
jgi:endonuclease III